MKPRQVIMVAAAAIILGLFWFAYTTHREPRYKGKSLTEWLILYRPLTLLRSDPSVFLRPGSQPEDAADAVRHIGTNALPFLVEWVHEYQEMSSLRQQRLYATVSDWKSSTPGREALLELIGGRATRGDYAARGFEILGEAARDAVPDLAREITHGSTKSAMLATGVLPYLGRNGLPPLLSVITNAALPFPIKDQALSALGRMGLQGYLGTNAQPAVALMISCLHDSDLAPSAAVTLGMLRLESELCVPALLECTRSTNATLRRAAVTSLGEFGRSARAAVPDLTKLHDDPDASLRQAATSALQSIAIDSSGP